jgi:hypothetical protein
LTFRFIERGAEHRASYNRLSCARFRHNLAVHSDLGFCVRYDKVFTGLTQFVWIVIRDGNVAYVKEQLINPFGQGPPVRFSGAEISGHIEISIH